MQSNFEVPKRIGTYYLEYNKTYETIQEIIEEPIYIHDTLSMLTVLTDKIEIRIIGPKYLKQNYNLGHFKCYFGIYSIRSLLSLRNSL